jgi:hypothetical protein
VPSSLGAGAGAPQDMTCGVPGYLPTAGRCAGMRAVGWLAVRAIAVLVRWGRGKEGKGREGAEEDEWGFWARRSTWICGRVQCEPRLRRRREGAEGYGHVIVEVIVFRLHCYAMGVILGCMHTQVLSLPSWARSLVTNSVAE